MTHPPITNSFKDKSQLRSCLELEFIIFRVQLFSSWTSEWSRWSSPTRTRPTLSELWRQQVPAPANRIKNEQREGYLEYNFCRIWQPLRLERRFSFCQEGEKPHLKECVLRFCRLKACQKEVKVSRIISGPQNDIFVQVNNGKPILLAYALVFTKYCPEKCKMSQSCLWPWIWRTLQHNICS